MRLQESTFICVMLLVTVIPFSLWAQAPMPPATPQTITEEEVRKFLDEYVTRYTKMDIDPFMALFSEKAVENRISPYADIYEIYRKHFFDSRSLSYHLILYSVQPYTRSAFVSGRYEVVQSLKPKGQQNIFRGNIQWNLVREEGSLRIMETDYGRDRAR